MVRKLIYYPDPILSTPCEDTGEYQTTDYRFSLASDMWEIMNRNNGAGLAAPQIGLSVRMFVWRKEYKCKAIWNPVLSSLQGDINSREGCLSLPGINVTIQRSKSSILQGIGVNGHTIAFIGNVIMTGVWQHEIDHLDGKLIIDNMNESDTISNQKALKALAGGTVENGTHPKMVVKKHHGLNK